jgi:hypothetical protein
MEILEEFEAGAHHAFAFLKVEFIGKVGNPGVGARAADKDEVSLFPIAWTQFASRTNGEPIARVATYAQERADDDEVGNREPERYLIMRVSRLVG